MKSIDRFLGEFDETSCLRPASVPSLCSLVEEAKPLVADIFVIFLESVLVYGFSSLADAGQDARQKKRFSSLVFGQVTTIESRKHGASADMVHPTLWSEALKCKPAEK